MHVSSCFLYPTNLYQTLISLSPFCPVAVLHRDSRFSPHLNSSHASLWDRPTVAWTEWPEYGITDTARLCVLPYTILWQCSDLSYRYGTEHRHSGNFHHGLLWCHKLAQTGSYSGLQKLNSVWPAITQRVKNVRTETVALPAVDSAKCCLVFMRNQMSPFAVLCHALSDTCHMNITDDLGSVWGRQTVSLCHLSLLFAVVSTNRQCLFIFVLALIFCTGRYRTTVILEADRTKCNSLTLCCPI